MSELNIYQRINLIMKEGIYLKKGSAGQGTGAQYDELIAVLAPKLAANGIVVKVDKIGESSSRQTAKGHYVYQCDYKVSYINIDNPDDRVETIVESHAQDNGDKAPGKANTYATKVSMLKIFGVETGDNEESREEIRDKSNVINEDQHAQLSKFCVEVGDNGAAWTALGRKMLMAYKIGDIAHLPASKFKEALDRCEKAAK